MICSDFKDFISLDTAELEFIAEEEIVDIIPTIRLEEFKTITGTIGPFEPPNKTTVPLWVALHFKDRKECVICLPGWMNAGYLQDVLQHERTTPTFMPLPFYYSEVAHLLLSAAHDDFQNADTIRSLVADIEMVRKGKLESELSKLSEEHELIQLDNLGSIEVNMHRAFLTKSMEIFRALDPKPEGDLGDTRQQVVTEVMQQSQKSRRPPIKASSSQASSSQPSSSSRFSAEQALPSSLSPPPVFPSMNIKPIQRK
ncbi:DNA replication complex GINS protein PSF2 [Monocercomonoides exilis]|uniref:DNA replication complex GINS protein PSF2 n=1 Tax=Monocercomonoides exilis TaxID=2049356 RepID=UPI003559F27D|nr:DNA replication complex GINS protein PSF2 [Monocercomonoides exilis]|eukprot:MONOS_6816.1-p1 / transcript=MONOS_6816.1 / gene=MONOS_6816 / organism=Monocercomonoides_exilis_PA203 / gene_product=DNA replication complex GINS protein PSF2 / transcript_product=DNA replication complex GINS protein PSF2 / location=Mono_scaffold00222:18403-19302(-) / protein_length=256 / sequence_SO=supercontig / SO=protein_coding / is_pseudo=false